MPRKSRKPGSQATEPQAFVPAQVDVGAYVRLSALDRQHKGDSIETQQAIIRAFVAEHTDFVLRDTYIDNDVTGTTFERPAFQKMLADAENGKISCIVTKDLSRFGRNAIDAGFYIEKQFPAQGLRLIAINDGYDSADGQSGGIMVSLKNLVNESYALEVGRKIRASKQMNIRAGAFVGRIPPYGYLKDPEDSHKLIVDVHAAPVVLRMYEMAAQGDRVSAIVKHLNDSGVVPPRRYFGQIGLVSSKEADCHIHWNKGIVYSILHNRIYCGDMVQGKSTTMNHVQKKCPESEWVVTENTHEAIVGRALWGQVQQIWENYKQGKSVPYTENIFLRKIFCGHCGFTLRRTRNNKKTYCFKCETRFTYDKDDCVPVSLNEDELKEQLLAMLRKKLLVFADNQSQIPAQRKVDADAELREVRATLGKTRGFLRGLYEHLVQGCITAEEYKAMKSNYESDIASMSALEQKLREDAISRAVREAEYSKAADSLAGVHTPGDLTAEIIDAFVERIDVFQNKRIKVTWRFMDETGAGCEEVGYGV